MIALDTNLLVYAFIELSPFHEATTRAIRPVVESENPWALPWPCVHEFLSVVTNPRIYQKAGSLKTAFDFIQSLTESPSIQVLAESPGYFVKLRHLATTAKISGAKIHDARIAALCLHHGVSELWTADRDFSLFPQLKTRNPLR